MFMAILFAATCFGERGGGGESTQIRPDFCLVGCCLKILLRLFFGGEGSIVLLFNVTEWELGIYCIWSIFRNVAFEFFSLPVSDGQSPPIPYTPPPLDVYDSFP